MELFTSSPIHTTAAKRPRTLSSSVIVLNRPFLFLLVILAMPFTTFCGIKGTVTLNSQLASTGITTSFKAGLYLYNVNGTTTLADGALAQFNQNFYGGVNFEDAVKFGNINEMLSYERDGIALAIERRPVFTDTDTLFLKLTQTTKRAYQLTFNAEKMDQPGLIAFLEDSYTGIPVPLDLHITNTINFVVDNSTASQAANRFRVVFKIIAGGPVPVRYSSIKAWQQQNAIAVQWKVENELNIDHYVIERSADGRNFISIGTMPVAGTGVSTEYSWVDKQPAAINYYRIQGVGKNEKGAYSTILLIKTTRPGAGITAYPNPVNNGKVNLQLANLPEGNYTIKLFSITGQLVVNNKINHRGGNATEAISLGASLAKGLYRLELINTDNTITTNISLLNQ